MNIQLTVSPRANETRSALAGKEMIPAVVYGPKQPSLSIMVEQRTFAKVFAEAGESTIIELTGLSEPIEVLVHEVVFHPTKGQVEHIDFYAIERGKEMTTEIPLTFTDTAPVEKSGGMVAKVLHQVTVTCRPSKLPKEIVVSLSGLAAADDQIVIANLDVPEGVTIDHEPDEVVAVAQGVREVESETVEAAAVDMSAVEVESKGKAEDEDV